MEVKQAVLDYIQLNAPSGATKELLITWLDQNKSSVEDISRQILDSHKSDSSVKLELTRDYFPTRSYSDLVLPCGVYDTARITLGSGRGRNWWCLLYPTLCYKDSFRAEVPDSSRESLSDLLSEEDYRALWAWSVPEKNTAKKPVVHVRSRLLELLLPQKAQSNLSGF